MTSKPHLPRDERLLDLLALRAVQPLTGAEQTELATLLRAAGMSDAPGDLDAAAAALELALLTEADLQAMPAGVRDRVASRAPAITQASAPTPFPAPRSGRQVIPWLIAASAAFLATVAWFGQINSKRPRDPVAFLSTATDRLTLAWGEWSDATVTSETPGVTGELAWSESLQAGYMKFTNLRVNDPTKEQYQLWIIDERGMGQRISGGIFNADGPETVVAITPAIHVRNAAAFAVTIEKPGGTWVSDMSRRAVIAAK